MGRRAKILLVAITILFQLVTPTIFAGEILREHEVTKGGGIIYGINGGTIGFLESLQQGCEQQLKTNLSAGAYSLQKEYARRLKLLKQEAGKLAEEVRDDEKAVSLTENSLRVRALVYLASFAGEALFPLLKAGCVIEIRPQ